MHKLLFSSLSVLVLVVFAASATARSEWSGSYIGINTGYAWVNSEVNQSVYPDAYLSFVPAPLTLSPSVEGAIVGVQLGHNWQAWNRLVLGLEADMGYGNLNGSIAYTTIQNNLGQVFPGIPFASERINWLGNLRPRLGFLPSSNLLIYGTGGFAFAWLKGSTNIDLSQTDNLEYPGSFAKFLPGWVAGAGIEWEVAEHWSLKTEYLYNKLQTYTFLANPVPANGLYQAQYIFRNSYQIAQIALTYRF